MISTPVGVMSNVCSYCAVRLPSVVTAVHLSLHILHLVVPAVSMGSMVKVWLTCDQGSSR